VSIEQILAVATRERLVIHGMQVFINSRDMREVERFQDYGCTIRPWYTPAEMTRLSAPVKQGWEVHLRGACDTVYETNEDGDEVDVTTTALKATALRLVRADG